MLGLVSPRNGKEDVFMPEFSIEDYKGAGPLRFGMNRQAIESVMGIPARVSTRGSGLRLSWEIGVATRLNTQVGSHEMTLSEISFARYCPGVSWRGQEIFQDLRRFAMEAARLDSAPLYGFGSLVLRDFGLCITGASGPVEERSISAFCRGHWDNELDGMKPFIRL